MKLEPNRQAGLTALQGPPLRRLKKLLEEFQMEYQSLLPSLGPLPSLLRADDWDGVWRLTVHVSQQQYETATEHYVAAQFVAMVKKFQFPKGVLDANPQEAAKKKFLKAEHRCKRVNLKFRLLRNRWNPHSQYEDIAMKLIRRVLGDEPPLDDILGRCDFGPGAAIGVEGTLTHFGRKLFASKLTCTPTALPFALQGLWKNYHYRNLLSEAHGWPWRNWPSFVDTVTRRVELVHHNKVAYVPKTAVVDRVIAIEPLLNTFVQKGIDLWIRERLLMIGIDLSNQAHNQRYAQYGSVTGDLVTIDLESASDSISIEVIRRLLPPAWFEFLNACRSPSYLSDSGETIRYHKFVSMGNGFCFPLETLIFTAICYAAKKLHGCNYPVSAYGDDLVVSQNIALVTIELLRYYGFKVNTEKTFIHGPFRESCGEDYMGGTPVRPAYITSGLTTITDVMAFHNSYRHRAGKHGVDPERLCFTLRGLVPRERRYMRPIAGLDDLCFDVEKDTFLSCDFAHWNRAWQTWSWTRFKTSPVPDPFRHPLRDYVVNAAVLRGSKSEAPLVHRRETIVGVAKYATN